MRSPSRLPRCHPSSSCSGNSASASTSASIAASSFFDDIASFQKSRRHYGKGSDPCPPLGRERALGADRQTHHSTRRTQHRLHTAHSAQKKGPPGGRG